MGRGEEGGRSRIRHRREKEPKGGEVRDGLGGKVKRGGRRGREERGGREIRERGGRE